MASHITRHTFPFVVLLLFFFIPGIAHSTTWSNKGPSFKDIRAVTISPQDSSVLFAGAFGWGIFKSTDGGVSWVNLRTGLTNAYVRSVCALSNTLVFCGTNDGVSRSTDGGATWTTVLSTPFSVRSIENDAASNKLYAATFGSGLYKSSNQGISWSPITVTDPVVLQTLSHLWSIGIFGKDSLYVGGSLSDLTSGGALFRSLDGGTSWIQVQRSTHIGSSVHSIAISPNSPSISLIVGTGIKGVYKSTNGGLNWLSINGDTTSHPLADLNINAVAFSANYRYAGTDSLGGFYARTLGDVSFGWNTGAGLPGPQAVVSSISINQANENTLYLGTEGEGIFRSTNAGLNWSARNTGMLGVAARVIERNGDGRMFLGADFGDGLWSSTDQGTTWVRSATLATSNAITAIQSTPNTSILYLAAYGSGVYKSTDAGATWNITDSTVLNPFVRTLSVHPSNPNLLYAGTGGGVYQTSDGGASWHAVNSGIPANTSVRSMAIDPAVPSTLYIGTDSLYLFRTTDAGGSWTNITSANGFLPQDIFLRTITVDNSSPSTLYVGSDSGRIYKSTNGGTNWSIRAQLPSTHSVRSIRIHPNNHDVFFASTFGEGIFTSVDSGGHWSAMNDGIADLEIYTLESDAANPLTLYAGSGSHGVYKTAFTYTNHPPVLAPVGNRFVVAGNLLRFTVAASDSDGTTPLLSATGLPAGASFVDSLNGKGSFSWVPGIPQIGTYPVTFHATDGSGVDSEQITIQVLDPGNSTSISLAVQAGWNLLSVPVRENDYRSSSVFPLALSTAFAYNGAYSVSETLRNGAGYWLKFGSAQDLNLGGITLTRDTIDVNAGWNLTGSCSSAFSVGAIAPVPPVAIVSSVYDYSGLSGYGIADSIRPGSGYWMKASQAGKIVLASGPLQQPVTQRSAGAGTGESAAGTLTFRNSSGGVKKLYLFSGAESERYELPPSPPPGSFDARFSSTQSAAADIGGGQGEEFALQVMSNEPTVELQWKFDAAASSFVLRHSTGDYLLTGEGRATLAVRDGYVHAVLKKIDAAPSAPKALTLRQNFPNPFNPSTVIAYDLPFRAAVTLSVIDVLGKEMTPLVHQEQGPGNYSVTWDAGNFSSGVYFYRIQAVDAANPSHVLSETRKMYLIR